MLCDLKNTNIVAFVSEVRAIDYYDWKHLILMKHKSILKGLL